MGRPSHCYPQDLLRLGSSCRCPASSAPRVPATPPEKFKCKDQTERLSDEKPGPAYCARGPDPHVQANGWRPIADPRGFIRRAGTYLHRYREGFASLHFTSLLHSFEPEEDRLGGVDGPDVLKRQRAAGEHGLGAAFDAGLCDGDAVPAALPRGRRRGGAHDGEGEEVQRVLLALQHAALHGEPPAPVQEAAAQLGPHRQVRHLARGQELDRTAPPPPTINISQRVVLKLPASPAGVKKDA